MLPYHAKDPDPRDCQFVLSPQHSLPTNGHGHTDPPSGLAWPGQLARRALARCPYPRVDNVHIPTPLKAKTSSILALETWVSIEQ